jgi:hypothetical protein
MQPPPPDAQLVEFLCGELPSLAELYDRFAHALDPFDEARDRAEQQFESTVSSWYDRYASGSELNRSNQEKSKYHDFRKAVIQLCKQYLKANPPRIQVRGLPKSD